MDSILDGVVTALSFDPTIGFETEDEGVYGITTEPWPGAAEVVIYYRYDDHCVTGVSMYPAAPDS
jgi:hypothetical protein